MELFFGAFTSEWERKRAAFLHDLSLGKRRPFEEEERRRRGAGAAGRESLRSTSKPSSHSFGRNQGARTRSGAPERSMKARFRGIATGGQPAVVKMASFGGGGRLGAMVNYVSRNGEVVVENERGEELQGRDALSSIGGEWDYLMKNRAESRDIGSFRIEVTTKADESGHAEAYARALVRQALDDRSFAFAISARADGSGYDIEGQVVLRSPSGKRLTGDAKATEIVQGRLDAAKNSEQADEHAGGAARFRFTGYGNGTDYGASRLRDLVEKHDGHVTDETGRTIGDAKAAGDLVQQEWREQLHSRKPRDVMHLILSAREGTDVFAFHGAAREFLAAEFGGHRYVFSIHDPAKDPKPQEAGGKRPHVHVHAIVAIRSDFGDRVETTIQSFRRWRETMADKAREQGIKMEMTDRRERASAAAFSRGQVRPISTVGRTEHEGTSEAAQRRYDAKRSETPSFARTERSRSYTAVVRHTWEEMSVDRSQKDVSEFAETQKSRLETESSVDRQGKPDANLEVDFGSQYRTVIGRLIDIVSEGDEMRQMSRSEFEAYEKRVETALFQAERNMQAEQRIEFDEIVIAAREHVDVHRELMELREQDNGQPGRQNSVDQDQDNANKRWDKAVSRHGLQTVEAANDIMLEVKHAREQIALADAGEIKTNKESLEANLNGELARAGELGAAGNSLIREIAEVDVELRVAIEAAEQSHERSSGNRKSNNSPAPIRSDLDDIDGSVREASSVQRQRNEGRSRSDDQSLRQERDSPEVGDTTRSDPAKQHVPRLEELQREAEEREERDRDQRER